MTDKKDTRERILITSLDLFARDGYEAVSVSSIAGEIGITKGALYKHYKSKRDIFNSIVERMFEVDLKQSKKYEVPAKKYDIAPEEYSNISIDNIRNFTIAQFKFWTEDIFASKFRRMLTLEQYRNEEMKELYINCLSKGPLEYIKDIFIEMMAEGTLKKMNPTLLATIYYSPFYYFVCASDSLVETKENLKLLKKHIEEFFKIYSMVNNQGEI